MNKAISTTLFLGFVLILSLANSDGRATKAGQGNTGAPGDEMLGNNPRTCISCHGGSNFQPMVEIKITNSQTNDIVSAYLPGETYKVETTVQTGSGSPAAYGFQIVSLRDSDNQGLETWSDPSDNAKIQFASNTNRTYVEHKGVSTSNSFSSQWTAPEEGSGNVTFYACGNAVNLSGDTSGDGAALAQITLEETTASKIENELSTSINLFPNPSERYIHIKGGITSSQISILNTQGQLVKRVDHAAQNEKINIQDLESGIYQLIILDEEGAFIDQKKFIKL